MREITFKKLSLQNFRCHDEMDFDFEKNKFIVIVGNNGKGKSSVFEGLYWTLFDETTKGRGGDSIVKKRTGQNCFGKLEFDISDNGVVDSYKIENYRKDKKYSNDKFIYKNGELILGKDPSRKEINNFIENIIMPKKIFSNCLLFSQFVKDSFLEMTHSGQKEILDSLLFLQSYDEYQKSMSSNIVFVNNKITMNEQNILNMKEKNDQILSFIKSELEQVKIFRNTELEKIKELESKLENIDKKEIIETISKLRAELDTNNKNISKQNIQLNKCEKELLELKETIEKKYDVKKLNLEIQLEKNNISAEFSKLKENMRDKLTILSEQYNEFKNKFLIEEKKISDETLNKINNYRKKKQEEIKELEKQVYDLDRSASHNGMQRADSNFKIESAIERRKTLVSILSSKNIICKECNQEITDKNKIEQYKKELKESEEYEKILSDKIEKLEKEYQEINSSKDKLTNKISELNHSLDEFENKENENKERLISEVKEKIGKDAKKILENKKEIQNEIEELDKNESIELEKIEAKYKSKLETIALKINEEYNKSKIKIDMQIKEIKKALEILNEKENSINNKLSEQNDISNNFEILTNDLELKRNNLYLNVEKYKNSIVEKRKIEKINNEKIKELTNERKNLEKEIDILKFWKTAFGDNGIRAILLDEAVPIMNKKAKELCSYIENIKVSFDSQKTLSSGKQRDAFSINALQTTNLSEFDDLSAGEIRLTNIIVLLCLRHLMEKMQGTKINVLLLDEILDSLDPENSMSAVEIIKNMSKEYCVVLISHTLRDWIECDEFINM